MEEIKQDFNAHVNLLMPSKVGYLHYVQDGGPHDVHGLQMGDDIRLHPLCLSQILMWGEHSIVLVISQFEFIDLQHYNLSQLQSKCTYPLWEVRSDQGVFKVPQDTITTNRSSHRWDIVG
jgi:hypothetical protein